MRACLDGPAGVAALLVFLAHQPPTWPPQCADCGQVTWVFADYGARCVPCAKTRPAPVQPRLWRVK